MAAKRRAPRVGVRVSEARKPRTAERRDDSPHRVTWSFAEVDLDGSPFPLHAITQARLPAVLRSLRDHEQATLDQRRRRGSHEVALAILSPEAQRRLRELNKEDVDTLVSVRIGARPRIWCIPRPPDVLALLWWDPQHQVCPSKKKHT